MKRVASPGLMHDTGCLGLVHWEEGMGREDGGGQDKKKKIQPVHSEGDQPWDFFGRTDAKAETPVLWPPHAKS